MASDKNQNSDIPCRSTFFSAIDLFLQLAKQQSSDGKISLDALKLIAKALHNDPQIKEKYCESLFEQCAAKMRQSMTSAPRVNIFGRIITQPFEHLLKLKSPPLVVQQLNLFFYAIEHILGRATYESFMERSSIIMERVSGEHGDNFTYEHLYQTEESWNIRWDCFIALAQFFSKFDVRKDWFKRVMHSDPLTPETGTSQFPFFDHQFRTMMMCIQDQLTNMSDQEKQKFEKRFSKAERNHLAVFLKNVAAIEENG